MMSEFQNYTNAELNIKMKSMENEYEVAKHKVLELVKTMEDLDRKYAAAKQEMNKRRNRQWEK